MVDVRAGDGHVGEGTAGGVGVVLVGHVLSLVGGERGWVRIWVDAVSEVLRGCGRNLLCVSRTRSC